VTRAGFAVFLGNAMIEVMKMGLDGFGEFVEFLL